MGGRIPVANLNDDDEGEDDDDIGEDDEEENFEGSGLGPMLTTLNSFNTNGLSRPTQKVETTTSLSSETTPLPSTETEMYPQITTASPNNNVYHRNRSFCLTPTTSLLYFVFIPAVWLFNY